jgi:peptidoglycan hydrolase FlgJ
MTGVNANNNVYTDFQGLAQLRNKAAADAPAALKEVGKHFEAMFIQMMLKSMRDATPGDPLFGNKEGDLYRDLFDKQISESMASQGSMGLADIIVKQLQHNAQLQEAKSSAVTQQAVQPTPSPDQSASAQIDTNKDMAYSSPSAFIKDIWPHAQRAAKQLGVDPQALAAQAALETGWGRNIVRHADGRSSNNLFGIKAGGTWQNESVTVPTVEYHDGIAFQEAAAFRAYDSLASSFQDYVQFLQNNPRYKDALMQADDPGRFTAALQQAGYATDPNYADKIQNIIAGGAFTSALSELKIGDAYPIG